MFLLWHPSLTAINLSYTFPILETSATALCGTTGICTFRSGTKSLIMMWWLCLLFRMASLAQAWDGCWKGKQIRQPEEGSSLMRWAWAKPCRPLRCFWQAAQRFGEDVWASDCDQRPKSRWILLSFSCFALLVSALFANLVQSIWKLIRHIPQHPWGMRERLVDTSTVWSHAH